MGFAAGPPSLIAGVAKVQGQSTGGVSPLAQAAATAALEGPQDQVGVMRQRYAARSQAAAAALNAIPGMECTRPAGAFYLYPTIAGLLGKTTPAASKLDTDEAFCNALLEEAGVATVHGAAFGKSPHFRLSTAAGDVALSSACKRIAASCGALS